MERWSKRYPRLSATGGAIVFIACGLATIQGIWNLFNKEPLFDYIATNIPLWPRILLLLVFIAIAILSIVLVVRIFQQTRKTVQTSTQTTMLHPEQAKPKLVNETKTLDWVTCDKCGFIGVRNIKTRELEEMEDNQRRTGQPILTRINSLGDTEPRHEKIPECIMQAEDFATLPPLSSQPLPLFYMQFSRQCQHFTKWQKGLTPKEHKEIIDRQLRQQSTAHNEPEISIDIDKCSGGNSVIRYGHPVQTIEVAFTLNVKSPPINVADLQLYMGDEILKLVSPTVPITQENSKGCYVAKYELSLATILKVPKDRRNNYRLCVVAIEQEWYSKVFSRNNP